jgi:hypothetical protein
LPREIGSPVRLCASQNVVLIRFVTTAIDVVPVFVDSRPVIEVWQDVKLIKIRGDQFAVCIVPWALANAASG